MRVISSANTEKSWPRQVWIAALAAAALVSGCGGDEIQVYRVAKETAANSQAGQPRSGPAGSGEASGSVPRFTWKVPSHWQEAPAGEMRLASFRVGAEGKQADISIIPLPGLAGGDLENVNRWRGQVGQAPVGEAELAKLQQPVRIAGEGC